MLQARVLTLGIFTDDREVDVIVTGREARKGLAEDDGGIDVKLLAHGDVPGDVPRLGDGREEDTLETDAVAAETLHSLREELLAGGGHTRDIVLLPLDGRVDVLEDLLDGVGDFVSNTITWD